MVESLEVTVTSSNDEQMVDAKVQICLRHIGSFYLQACKKKKDQ